ncbi:MAG TPA: ABC transporter substrate-binding protein, partial [Papillibacter sp.]|nr:ABC transporter substrate-binding protein [Papillibacter sp.]
MRKRSIAKLVLALLLAVALLAGCAQTPKTPPSSEPTDTTGPTESPSAKPIDPNKDTIVFGAARSQSGVFAVFDESVFGPIYRMWADEINADGGLYVEEYGKKMKIELKVYDDTSDLGTMTRLYEKLILEDKVDFLLPPVSTAFLYALAPIANRYGYILMGAEGGSATLKESIAKYPYFFSTLNFSDTQIPALVDLCKEQNITSAYIVYIEDLHGTEYSGAAVPALASAGVDIKGIKSVPPDIQDMTPILNDAKESGAQAFFMFAYPDQNYLAIGQAMAIGYNPDVFLVGPGGSFEVVKLIFGEQAIEGLIGWGAWNEKSSETAAAFAKKFMDKWGDHPEISIDWWGHIIYYAGLEVLAQAIERAGTLDNAVVRDIIATEKFDTMMGEVYFTDNLIAGECYLGNIGQWQNGVFEVIDVGDTRTADPIVPKPAWPAA